MPPRPDVSEERRSEILDAAERLFAKNGLSNTRMDDIVAASGLSKGAIYWYFRKKDDIVNALLERLFLRGVSTIERIAAEAGPASNRLVRIGEAIAAEYKALARIMPIAYEFYAMAIRQRVVRQFIATMYQRYSDAVRPVLLEGVRCGEFRRDLDVEHALLQWLATYEGLGLVAMIDRKAVDWNVAGERSTRLLLDGIAVSQ